MDLLKRDFKWALTKMPFIPLKKDEEASFFTTRVLFYQIERKRRKTLSRISPFSLPSLTSITGDLTIRSEQVSSWTCPCKLIEIFKTSQKTTGILKFRAFYTSRVSYFYFLFFIFKLPMVVLSSVWGLISLFWFSYNFSCTYNSMCAWLNKNPLGPSTTIAIVFLFLF